MSDLISREQAIELLNLSRMDDLISRQAAINALMPIYKSASLRNRNVFSTARKCMAAIVELPSAQPEIIRCKDCKWIGDIGCAIQIVDDSDRPSENDFCSFAERKDNE